VRKLKNGKRRGQEECCTCAFNVESGHFVCGDIAVNPAVEGRDGILLNVKVEITNR
jgi:hypothetical protein